MGMDCPHFDACWSNLVSSIPKKALNEQARGSRRFAKTWHRSNSCSSELGLIRRS
jgi:hypothetical protein